MSHPTTRLLTLLELLQTHAHVSGEAFASRLEGEPRMVRCSILMLQKWGCRRKACADLVVATACAQVVSYRLITFWPWPAPSSVLTSPCPVRKVCGSMTGLWSGQGLLFCTSHRL
ncbi:hypothetical protein [Dictyobacter alpinus]|uniref:hypothetical protein n=1 Tax=Dictyobacter alpinus TaxID=2014873 RepID=UPI000F83FC64|nr:hypothetical protein [Dictyobacter alpinus]